MIEMPEASILAGQMNKVLTGKTVVRFARGPLTHKFPWLSRMMDAYPEKTGKGVKGFLVTTGHVMKDSINFAHDIQELRSSL